MSDLWIDIEALVLDGKPLNMGDGRRLAELTEIALTRLLSQRGTTAIEARWSEGKEDARPKRTTMRPLTGANEARWAEELAMVIYRAMDREF